MRYRCRRDRRCNLRADSESSGCFERDRNRARLIGISSALVTRHHWRPHRARSGAAGMMREGPTMAAHDALRTILPVAGWPEERARSVEFTGGGDPVLPTPFLIGETAAAALGVLGCAEDREEVTKAVAKWDALELEEAIIAEKGAGGMVRSMAEWAKHPQGMAIASLPLMEIVKIGDAPVEKLPQGERPLSGVRVLDLTRVLAGPTCARTLAEHGADVLKITAPHLPNIGYQEFDTGHGKLSAHLDLRQPKDLATLRDLARESDVFSQGYRPGTLGMRGLSPEELAALRPGLVYVSLCAFSHVGPWASRRGFDTVVQNVSGITTRQGELFPGAEPGPQFYPVSAIDYLTGYLMAFGAMVALGRRAREGGSWLVRISLAQTGRWLVSRGEVPESALTDVPKEFTPEELTRWSTTSDTPVGRLGHLKPVVQLSETPPFWARPSVPLGHNEPAWPPRS